MQRIDGFLAVLNITGGSFSPKSKKLPFAVTSVDGDNYLLYYSSIDLAGSMTPNNYGSPRMKRSLSMDDSRADQNRLRIPVKGRIQLVIRILIKIYVEYQRNSNGPSSIHSNALNLGTF